MQSKPPSYPPPSSMPPAKKRSSTTTLARVILGLFGGFLGLCSFPLTLVALVEIIQGAATSGDFGAAALFAIAALMSTVMLYFAMRPTPQKPFEVNEGIERSVLHVARQQGGVLSVGSLALNSQLSIDASQQALEIMANRGVATIDVDHNGDLVYRFAALSTGPAQAQGQQPATPHDRDLADFDRKLQQAQGAQRDDPDLAFDFNEPEAQDAQQPEEVAQHHTTASHKE